MNEQERNSQVSALFDGELDPAQAELVTRRLLKDPTLRASWSRYAVIGASLRGDPLSVPSRGRVDLAGRVRLAVEREPVLAVDSPSQVAAAPVPVVSRWRTMAWGSGLAAGVALMAIVVMRQQAPEAPALLATTTQSGVPAPVVGDGAAPSGQVVKAVGDRAAPPSYTTPLGTQMPAVRPATPLVNYVVAHAEYTTPVIRLSPLAAVISGNFDPTENTVEMTEAEVGARR